MTSTTAHSEEILGRLGRLERQNRQLKAFGLSVLVLAGASVLIYATQPIPETIRTHELHVLDNSGRVRVSVDNYGVKLHDAERADLT